MQADILATGSELVSPDRTDTNSLWITEQLNRVGIQVRRKLCIGDDLALVSQELARSLESVPLVFITGGLGPTEDDVTRSAIATASSRPLQHHQALEDDLRAKFLRFGRTMAENNVRQCMLPEGATALANPRGTAPGIHLVQEKSQLFALPGPPREMQPMFTELVMPHLAGLSNAPKMSRRILRVIGLGESTLDERISPLYKDCQNPEVGLLFSHLDIEIRLTSTGQTEEECNQLNESLALKFYAEVGSQIYGEGDTSLAEIVAKQLAKKEFRLFILDLACSGLAAQRLLECDATLQGSWAGSQSPDWLEKQLEAWLAADPSHCLLRIEASPAENEVRRFQFQLTGAIQQELVTALPGDRSIQDSRAAQCALDMLRKAV
jgi:nicotinamide-nucleotide amidase